MTSSGNGTRVNLINFVNFSSKGRQTNFGLNDNKIFKDKSILDLLKNLQTKLNKIDKFYPIRNQRHHARKARQCFTLKMVTTKRCFSSS